MQQQDGKTEAENVSIERRIAELETQVAELATQLQHYSPRTNARKIKLISLIIGGLSQTIRQLAQQISVLRQGNRNRSPL